MDPSSCVARVLKQHDCMKDLEKMCSVLDKLVQNLQQHC